MREIPEPGSRPLRRNNGKSHFANFHFVRAILEKGQIRFAFWPVCRLARLSRDSPTMNLAQQCDISKYRIGLRCRPRVRSPPASSVAHTRAPFPGSRPRRQHPRLSCLYQHKRMREISLRTRGPRTMPERRTKGRRPYKAHAGLSARNGRSAAMRIPAAAAMRKRRRSPGKKRAPIPGP